MACWYGIWGEPWLSDDVRRAHWARKLKELYSCYALPYQVSAYLVLGLAGISEEQPYFVTMPIAGGVTEIKVGEHAMRFASGSMRHTSFIDRQNVMSRFTGTPIHTTHLVRTRANRSWAHSYSRVLVYQSDDEEKRQPDGAYQQDDDNNGCRLCVQVVWLDVGCIGQTDRIDHDPTWAEMPARFDIDNQRGCEDIAQQVHGACSTYGGREEARKNGVTVGHTIHQCSPSPPPPRVNRISRNGRTGLRQSSETVSVVHVGESVLGAGDRVCPRMGHTTQ